MTPLEEEIARRFDSLADLFSFRSRRGTSLESVNLAIELEIEQVAPLIKQAQKERIQKLLKEGK